MAVNLDFQPSLYVIAAICGNWWQESTFSPGLWEGRRVGTWTEQLHGYGLGQWTNYNTTTGRLYHLHEWLVANGRALDDGNSQIEYLLYEDYWTPKSDYPEFHTLTDFLKSDSTDLARLTHAYNWCWEGIHDGSWDARVGYAQQCYDYILAHADDPTITTWYNGNNYLGDAQRLNNAVLAFRFLNGQIGGLSRWIYYMINSNLKSRKR